MSYVTQIKIMDDQLRSPEQFNKWNRDSYDTVQLVGDVETKVQI